jgi:hypothetical protein
VTTHATCTVAWVAIVRPFLPCIVPTILHIT